MTKATKIMRSSIYTFLKGYHSFTSIAALLVVPFSASVLVSQSLAPSSSSLQTISLRLRLLFEAAGFPNSIQFFSLLNLKVSQTIFSLIFTLPFTLTFLNLAKVALVQKFRENRRLVTPLPFSSLLHTYRSVLLTHLFSSFLLLSANAAVFSLLFLAFNTLDILGLSSTNSSITISALGAILYSLVIANTMVICNMAAIVSATEGCSGSKAVLKACVLIKGRVATALTIALPANLGMAALEELFHYRVIKPYYLSERFNSGMISEGIMVAYIYSLIIVLDIIMNCVFFESCKSSYLRGELELEPEEKVALQV